MCDDIQHCQAYQTKEYALSCWADDEENEKWNKIKRAVSETQNQVITYQGEIINAFFHAHSGGRTENIENIWGREKIPYLKSVEGLENRELKEEKIIEMSVFNQILKEKHSDYIPLTNNESNLIKILEINSSGRVSKVKVSNLILEGTEFRTLLGLRSTFFEIMLEGEKIIINTDGYGHGVGLSQEGANSMALEGKSYKEIITHYYSGVKIEEINE